MPNPYKGEMLAARVYAASDYTREQRNEIRDYIILAVNAHEDLVAACEKAVACAESWIYDQLDGTSRLEKALASLDPVRAILANVRPPNKPLANIPTKETDR